ncbi:MAG: hypothetical protein EZS28_002003 [Streblomastix strix]|uniref:Uncharacterized protein n=1 Tax=Streblomastix strix TaxID=222440 RepID=A0A5J4X7F3_9EUKA|nr:MAG: hypothetical protein EZS28_002003 [Streblomastix strix]
MAHHRDDEDDDENQQINQQNRNQADHGAQNADVIQNALPDWLNILMGRPRDTSNAIRALQQHEATTKLFEHCQRRKAFDLNPTSERASKRKRELLTGDGDAEDDVETALLAVLIQRACVAASTALIQVDFPATQRFILTCHHVARVIAGDASQRRDMKLVTDEFKLLIGKKGSVLNASSKQSKDQIKELNTSIKLIASKQPIPHMMQQQPFLSQPASQQFTQFIPQAMMMQSQQQQPTSQIGSQQRMAAPKYALLGIETGSVEHQNQQMEKDSDDDADADSE